MADTAVWLLAVDIVVPCPVNKNTGDHGLRRTGLEIIYSICLFDKNTIDNTTNDVMDPKFFPAKIHS